MKLLLIGGHLSPALALLDNLPSDWEVTFVGRKYTFEGDESLSLEYRVITQKKIPFISLTTGRLQRRLTHHSITSLSKFPYGYMQALAILLPKRPDIVVGFGGYLSVPVALAARTLRIPILIHEQTMGAGMANKFISRFARIICISWPTSQKYFPKEKAVLTGNLIRPEIIDLVKNLKPQTPTPKTPLIYITGGSGGSHAINLLVESALPELVKIAHVIHQTGDAKEFDDYTRLAAARAALPKDLQSRYEVMKFVSPEEVGNIYAKSQLIISRSGMNTISELLLLQKPCLLIPLVTGQTHEQMTNAEYLVSAGLAEILPQEAAMASTFLKKVHEMFDRLSEYRLKKNVDISIHLHAAEALVQILQSMYEKKAHQKS